MDERPFPAARPRAAGIAFDAPHERRARDVWDDLKTGLDFVAHNLPRWHGVLARLNPYPRPWESLHVLGHEGARLAACYGPGRPGAPAILFAPGTFQTKDDTPRKRRAIRLWREHGAHVLILDLRGFGGSHGHLGSAGYLEARDLHHAADWLRERSGAPRVVLWGESLGGASALLAAALPGAEERFERVLAWSPFADLADAARVSSTDDPRGRSLVGVVYRWLLRMRTNREAQDFAQYLALRAQALGMTPEELVEAGSPERCAPSLRVPSFVYHAEDDPIVPVDHARMLERHVAPGRLAVEVVPRGAHLDFDREAPSWFGAVVEQHLSPDAPDWDRA